MSEATGDDRLDRGRELAELHLGEGWSSAGGR